MKYSSKPPFWEDRELELINVVELFQQKPLIMKKVEIYLEDLKQGLIEEIPRLNKEFPNGTDIHKGQVARGENNKGFPFVSLDMPQMFSKTEMFTFRTLFWWGHYLGFSFILKGNALAQYTKMLIQHKSGSDLKDVYIAWTPTPWEWELNAKNFKLLSSIEDPLIDDFIHSVQYIKLIRIFPLEDSGFSNLDWKHEGVQVFKNFVNVILQ